MTHRILGCALLLGAALATTAATTAEAGYPDACCAYHNSTLWYPWHGSYYDPAWGGSPVALVVPPTAMLQTKYSWGVTNTDVVRIYHQFGRQYPGSYNGGNGFIPTPPQPGSTDQFGVYYVRGPW